MERMSLYSPDNTKWKFITHHCPACGGKNITYNSQTDIFSCLDCDISFDVIIYEEEREKKE